MTSLIEPVAVVGFAGKFPGAGDCTALWRLLSEGREGLRTLTEEQLLAAGVSPDSLREPNYVRVNGDIDGLELFDAAFFRMTPREATVCDPQLRIFLETAHAAVENAGYDPTRLSDVGVYAATGHSLYMDHQLQGTALAAGQRDMLAGVFNYRDYVATLTSYKLNFTGPSLTVLTACSSSLVTLHLATQALNNGECDVALIGGTEVETWGQGYFWNSGGPLSQDGHCRPFDAHATGTVFSTGVGAVVLKRLPDALRDGDAVRAVVRATAVNNDGADKVGFSAPSISGQTAVVAESLGVADVDPESIGYVEAHGTGTALGDPIEFAALTEAFRRAARGRTLPTGYCGLGSVKSNIGHLGHAAGVASLIKVAQCFEHDLLPATINLKEPNPALVLEESPFYLLTQPRPWPRTPGRPRRAGVNSLGFGGTNVHVILEEPPLPAPVPVAGRSRLVVWSARNDAAERAYRTSLAEHLRESADEEFPAAVSTLQEGRTRHPVRGFAVAASRLEAVEAVTRESLAARSVPSGGPRPVAFLFPGQGSQHAGMASGLYRADPTFTAEVDAALDALEAAGARVRRLWTDGTEEQLLDTGVAQPLLFAVEYALARMLLHWGVKPAGMIGHSVGELVAAAVAGMIPMPTVAAMVAARGRAMAAAPPGAMAAVRALAAELRELPEGVTVAAENGPQQTVVASAEEEALSGFLSALASRGVAAARLRTAHAFHSPSMSASARAFAGELPHLVASPAEIPVFSAATARPLTVQEAGRAEFWAEQVHSPVYFGAALDEMLGTGDWLLLEVGPGRALTSVLRGHPGVRAGRHQALPTLPRRQGQVDGLPSVMEAAGTLWAEGHELDWAALRPGEPLRRTAVPGYPYQRRAYWARPDRPEERAARPSAEPEPVVAPPATAPPARAAAFSVLSWMEQPAPPTARETEVPAAVLLPQDPQIALHLVLCLQQAGMRIVPLRAGERYSDEGAEFVVRPRAEDLGRALRAIAAQGRPVHRLVHAWGMGAGAGAADSTADGTGLVLQSLLDLVQQGARAWPGAAPGVLVLADRSVDVSGGEPVDPARAGLPALVRTLALELGAGSCRLVDVGAGVSEPELAAELSRDDPEPVVAVRRDRRWIPTERPCLVPEAGHSPLRRGGVYLMTGGLGGLGLELAKGIARAGLRPRLVLLGRRPVDQPAPADPDVRDGLSELTALGAEVHPFAVDVADVRALRRVADTVTARLGPVNGIFHLAGVPGDGMLLLRDRHQFEEVLRPKVAGTLAIEEVFTGRPPLDFFVAFSSRAAVNGLVGSGDYAAANAFLDAFVSTTSLADGRAMSIGWPAWSELGMAARRAVDLRMGAAPGTGEAWQVVLAPDYPFLDEHRIDGTPVLPGTGQLDLLVRALAETYPDTAGRAVRLREVVLRHPLVVTGSRRVTIAFEPTGDGWRFTLSSQAAEGGEAVVHATGQADTGAGPAAAVDLVSVRERLTDRRAPEPINGPNRLFTFGPRWNNATELRLPPGGGPEKLVCLHLPDQFREDLDRHPLHPALLDRAVSSARDPERDGILLPFMYQSVVIHEPLPATFTSYIVRHPAPDGLIVADITLLADDGRVLAEFNGFTMRVAQRNYLEESEAASSTDRQRRAVTSDTDRSADEGVPPKIGVRLTLELLSSRPLRHVLVRPFRAGRPVPLPAAAAAPSTGASPRTTVPAGTPRAAAKPEPAAAAPKPTIDPRSASEIDPGRPAGPAAVDDVPERLRRLWASALGSDHVGDGEDFFELGGNSLSAIDLMARIRDEFGVELNIALLFDHPTLDGIAEVVRGSLTARQAAGAP